MKPYINSEKTIKKLENEIKNKKERKNIEIKQKIKQKQQNKINKK